MQHWSRSKFWFTDARMVSGELPRKQVAKAIMAKGRCWMEEAQPSRIGNM